MLKARWLGRMEPKSKLKGGSLQIHMFKQDPTCSVLFNPHNSLQRNVCEPHTADEYIEAQESNHFLNAPQQACGQAG